MEARLQATSKKIIQLVSPARPHYDINGLVQERRNSSALALQLRLSCIKTLIWSNIIRCYVQYNRDRGRPQVQLWTHNRYTMSCPQIIAKLWGVSCKCFWENWPCANETILWHHVKSFPRWQFIYKKKQPLCKPRNTHKKTQDQLCFKS